MPEIEGESSSDWHCVDAGTFRKTASQRSFVLKPLQFQAASSYIYFPRKLVGTTMSRAYGGRP